MGRRGKERRSTRNISAITTTITTTAAAAAAAASKLGV